MACHIYHVWPISIAILLFILSICMSKYNFFKTLLPHMNRSTDDVNSCWLSLLVVGVVGWGWGYMTQHFLLLLFLINQLLQAATISWHKAKAEAVWNYSNIYLVLWHGSGLRFLSHINRPWLLRLLQSVWWVWKPISIKL